MNRRHSLAALASMLVGPMRAAAQQGRVPIVGMLITHPPVTDKVVQSLRNGLRQYGYEDGRNVRLEVRTALGQFDRIPGLAQELAGLPADVIVLANEPALRAVKQATATIPIVMVGYTDDPVTLGWIASYRRPGGNVTGIFNVNSALTGKRLEMLREMLPKVTRVAVLWDPAFARRPLQELQRAADLLHVHLQPIEVSGPDGIDGALDRQAKQCRCGDAFMVPRVLSPSNPHRGACPGNRAADRYRSGCCHRGWMPALIRSRQLFPVRTRSLFRRSPAEGRRGGGFAGGADLAAEADRESENRKGARHYDSAVDPGEGG